MRFLMINPYYPISECPSPPLGVAYLAGALERAGIETRVMDLVVNRYTPELLEEFLGGFRPDVVGITAVTMSVKHALGVLTDVKQLNSEITTVIGGPHVTFQAAETLHAYPSVDLVALGEGEEAIVELTRAIERGRGLEDVRGLALRRNGQVFFTAPRPPGLDVNQLPYPARHLLPLGRYRALGMAISMTTSRGCPHQCIFCVGRQMVGARVRYRDPVKVVEEMEDLSRLGFLQINMADDLFTANKKHCFGVCDEILRRGLKIKWTSFARVDTVSPEVLTRMKEAGCTAVSFGVESGNAEILKTARKGITPEQVLTAVNMCNEAGVAPMASFVLGLPGETPETMAQTVEFGRRLNDLGVAHGFHLLAPFPGTKVRDDHEAYGLKILTHDWNEYHANRAIVETPTVTKAMFDDVVIKWEGAFDEYLGMLKDQWLKGEIDAEAAWPVLNLERTCLTYDLMMDRTIEKVGAGTENGGGPTEALTTLVDRVTQATTKPRNLVQATIEAAVANGALRLQPEAGSRRWAWRDYLHE